MARKQVIVTGNTGIAASLIRALNERGDSVFVIGGTDEASALLAKSCSNIIGFYSADLRSEEDCVSAFALASKALGSVSDVVGIVGGSGRKFGDGQFDQIPLSGWDETLKLNLTTSFLTLREGLRNLESNGGSITLTSSVLATSPVSEGFTTHAYATSKYAIEGMVKLAAKSFVHKKIRVNAVAPALVSTPMSKRATEDPLIQDFVKQKQPLSFGPLAPSDLVLSYIYLIDNVNVTGEILTIDGGWSSVTGL
jgi:NAD(P)-dependent dehydrogenase (short-subunit alcohol dehydrogenase family)